MLANPPTFVPSLSFRFGFAFHPRAVRGCPTPDECPMGTVRARGHRLRHLRNRLALLRGAFVEQAGDPAKRPGVAWAALGTLLLCFRTVLWFRYRPAPSSTPAAAPARP